MNHVIHFSGGRGGYNKFGGKLGNKLPSTFLSLFHVVFHHMISISKEVMVNKPTHIAGVVFLTPSL